MKIKLSAFILNKLSFIMLKLNQITTIYMEFFITCLMNRKSRLEQLIKKSKKDYVVGHNGHRSYNYHKIHQK
jgi:hypothetical protein